MITITIQDIPPSNNKFAGRKNVWEYRQIKKQWEEIIYYSAIGKKGIKGKVKVIIEYFFPDKTRRDPDNYSGKFILDGLVRAGLIDDDNFKTISLELKGNYDKANPRTEIIIIKL